MPKCQKFLPRKAPKEIRRCLKVKSQFVNQFMNIKFTEIKISMNWQSSMSWPVLTCRTQLTNLFLDQTSSETRCDSPWAKSWNQARIFIDQCFSLQDKKLFHLTKLFKSKGKYQQKKPIRFWMMNHRILWICASKFLRLIVRCQLKKKQSMMMNLKKCIILKIKNLKNNSEDKDVVLSLLYSWLDLWLILF